MAHDLLFLASVVLQGAQAALVAAAAGDAFLELMRPVAARLAEEVDRLQVLFAAWRERRRLAFNLHQGRRHGLRGLRWCTGCFSWHPRRAFPWRWPLQAPPLRPKCRACVRARRSPRP